LYLFIFFFILISMNKIALICILFIDIFMISTPAESQLRSFDALFPGITERQKQRIFTDEGMINSFLRNETPLFVPASNSGINLWPVVMEKIPSQMVEALAVVPYNNRPLSRLDIYNVLQKIRNLSNYTINSKSRGTIPLFEGSTRIDTPNRNRPIPDPPPALILPSTETIYVRVKDAFFGNTYLRGDFSTSYYGITYRLTNSTTIWYAIFPVMGTEKLAMVIYAEPVAEGLLVYGLAGLDIPMFIATTINLADNINMRVRILMSWLIDNLKELN